jgi:protease II
MAKINVPAEDGVKIPITLIFDISKLKMDGTNPLLVRVYGCHGVSLYTGYDGTMLPLLDDGWIIAYCHVRGGNELGKHWHLQAIQDNKPITFKDLLVCVSALHSLGYSSPQLTAAFGISSGALSVAMACNYNPKIFGSVILEMPLVNLCDNLMYNNHYINSMDEDEFGNIRSNLKLVKSLCPFSNLKPQDYPSYFITASTIDPLISINGVDKYVDRLKDSISDYMRCHPPMNDVGITRYLPRGTVLYQKISHHGHWANSNDKYHRQQGLLGILFLNQTIHNYMYY